MLFERKRRIKNKIQQLDEDRANLFDKYFYLLWYQNINTYQLIELKEKLIDQILEKEDISDIECKSIYNHFNEIALHQSWLEKILKFLTPICFVVFFISIFNLIVSSDALGVYINGHDIFLFFSIPVFMLALRESNYSKLTHNKSKKKYILYGICIILIFIPFDDTMITYTVFKIIMVLCIVVAITYYLIEFVLYKRNKKIIN